MCGNRCIIAIYHLINIMSLRGGCSFRRSNLMNGRLLHHQNTRAVARNDMKKETLCPN
jgi:hypothetical protein